MGFFVSSGNDSANADPLIPVLIGLPGAGKSSVARELAKHLSLPIFESDRYFREARSLPNGATDPRRAIMSQFLDRVARDFPDKLAAIRADAERTDSQGRCPLYDGKRFREYGESVFRAFEIEMLAWAFQRGELRKRLPDLSASAPLYEDNRRLFSARNGYLPVLLDTPRELLCRRILEDYGQIRLRRELGETDATIRGGYEKRLDHALREAGPIGSSAQDRVLAKAAEAIIAQDFGERITAYRSYARHVLSPTAEITPAALAAQILPLLVEPPKVDL